MISHPSHLPGTDDLRPMLARLEDPSEPEKYTIKPTVVQAVRGSQPSLVIRSLRPRGLIGLAATVHVPCSIRDLD